MANSCVDKLSATTEAQGPNNAVQPSLGGSLGSLGRLCQLHLRPRVAVRGAAAFHFGCCEGEVAQGGVHQEEAHSYDCGCFI